MSSDNDDPKRLADTEGTADSEGKPDDRNLTATGGNTTAPPPPPRTTQGGEVVKDLVVPKPLNESSKSEDRGSPGVQDRDVIIQMSPPKETEVTEVIQEKIIPHSQAEHEDKPAGT